jgi:hypothetical protein
MDQILRVVPPLRTMPLVTITPALPETRTRRCPSCKSERTAPVGHVIGCGGMIKEELRCAKCATAFLQVEPLNHLSA